MQRTIITNRILPPPLPSIMPPPSPSIKKRRLPPPIIVQHNISAEEESAASATDSIDRIAIESRNRHLHDNYRRHNNRHNQHGDDDGDNDDDDDDDDDDDGDDNSDVGNNNEYVSSEGGGDISAATAAKTKSMASRYTLNVGRTQPDQVARLAAAHAAAAIASTTKEGEMCDDEDEVERIANAARNEALRAHLPPNKRQARRNLSTNAQQTKTVRAVHLPPPATPTSRLESAALVLQPDDSSSADGSQRVLTMEKDYALAQRYYARHADNAASTGAVAAAAAEPAVGARASRDAGMRTMARAQYLFRDVEAVVGGGTTGALSYAPQLPRIIENDNPWDYTFMRRLLTNAPSDSIPVHLNPHMEHGIRSAMWPSPRAHEEAMLRTPRGDEPPCSNGAHCYGNKLQCAGGGATLVAFFLEHEWAPYMRSGDVSKLPSRAQVCLLCTRIDVARVITSLRVNNCAYKPVRFILTPFYNLVNVPGEYPLEDCMGPSQHLHEGLAAPMVRPRLDAHRRVPDPTTGVIRFPQTLRVPTARSTDNNNNAIQSPMVNF